MNYAECLHCGYKGSMILLSSIDKRMCPECKSYNVWRLKPNQPSVLIENKRGDHDATDETQTMRAR
jgi:predicted Zn-ribbon and HTH transcriptional regulator